MSVKLTPAQQKRQETRASDGKYSAMPATNGIVDRAAFPDQWGNDDDQGAPVGSGHPHAHTGYDTDTPEQPAYAVVHHRVTTPDGVTHPRTSIHCRYTYVVAGNPPQDPDTWLIESWHTTYNDALNTSAASRMVNVHVIPVTRSEQTTIAA